MLLGITVTKSLLSIWVVDALSVAIGMKVDFKDDGTTSPWRAKSSTIGYPLKRGLIELPASDKVKEPKNYVKPKSEKRKYHRGYRQFWDSFGKLGNSLETIRLACKQPNPVVSLGKYWNSLETAMLANNQKP